MTSAADTRGEASTAPSYATGAGRNHSNVIPNHAAKITPTTMTKIISGSGSGIEILFAFVAQQIHSCRSLLLLSVPAECAVVSVTHSKPSNRHQAYF